jgi:DNA-binding transcriptional MerR regulator
MELLEIVDIAERLGLPVSTVRFYRDRFILYLPTVRIGRHLRYPPEAVEMIRAIDDAARTGATMDEIEQALQWRYPVTVITSQPIASTPERAQALAAVPSALEALATQQAALQEDIEAVRDALADLASMQHVQSVRAEMVSLSAALAQRESAQRHALRALAGQVRQDMDEIRRLLTHLSGLLENQRGQPAPVSPSGASYAAAAETPGEAVAPNGRISRTPRRMGHPYRASGTGPLQS